MTSKQKWVAVIAVVAAGLILGWEWLTANGLLVIVLVILACLGMCAIGMGGGGDGDKNS